MKFSLYYHLCYYIHTILIIIYFCCQQFIKQLGQQSMGRKINQQRIKNIFNSFKLLFKQISLFYRLYLKKTLLIEILNMISTFQKQIDEVIDTLNQRIPFTDTFLTAKDYIFFDSDLNFIEIHLFKPVLEPYRHIQLRLFTEEDRLFARRSIMLIQNAIQSQQFTIEQVVSFMESITCLFMIDDHTTNYTFDKNSPLAGEIIEFNQIQEETYKIFVKLWYKLYEENYDNDEKFPKYQNNIYGWLQICKNLQDLQNIHGTGQLML
ncbi:hypothetical protein pb186bvf_004818 [Paramecium bursaria]